MPVLTKKDMYRTKTRIYCILSNFASIFINIYQSFFSSSAMDPIPGLSPLLQQKERRGVGANNNSARHSPIGRRQSRKCSLLYQKLSEKYYNQCWLFIRFTIKFAFTIFPMLCDGGGGLIKNYTLFSVVSKFSKDITETNISRGIQPFRLN